MFAVKPNKEEYPDYFSGYVSLSLGENPLTYLNESKFLNYLQLIDSDNWSHKYAEDKWTVSELVLHLIDAERVFCYRALRFSRNDKTTIVGFDQNVFVPNSGASERTKDSLLDEYTTVRNATISFFKNLSTQQIDRVGQVGDSSCSVRALAYIIVGHEIHHHNILKERYFNTHEQA